jgi:hypothetical protein
VPLHATMCRYDGVTGPIDEVVHAGRRLAAELSQAPGFVTYALLDAGHGVIVSINVFEDRTDLDAADRLVGPWTAHQLAALLPHPSEVIAGEVIVQRGM